MRWKVEPILGAMACAAAIYASSATGNNEVSLAEAEKVFGGIAAAQCGPFATTTCTAGACASRTVVTAQENTRGSPQGTQYCGGTSSCSSYSRFVKACATSIGSDIADVNVDIINVEIVN